MLLISLLFNLCIMHGKSMASSCNQACHLFFIHVYGCCMGGCFCGSHQTNGISCFGFWHNVYYYVHGFTHTHIGSSESVYMRYMILYMNHDNFENVFLVLWFLIQFEHNVGKRKWDCNNMWQCGLGVYLSISHLYKLKSNYDSFNIYVCFD